MTAAVRFFLAFKKSDCSLSVKAALPIYRVYYYTPSVVLSCHIVSPHLKITLLAEAESQGFFDTVGLSCVPTCLLETECAAYRMDVQHEQLLNFQFP